MMLSDLRSRYRAREMTKHEYADAMYALHTQLYEYADFICETDIAKIVVTDHRVMMTTRSSGITLVCDRRDKRTVPIEIMNLGAYERAETDMLLRLIDPGSSFFDIGANIGWYAMTVAKRFPDVRVLAFEPIPTTCRSLRENVKINALANVESYDFGLSDHEGPMDFCFVPEFSGSTSSEPPTDGSSWEMVSCRVTTLDRFVQNTGVWPSAIKCDVEGAELLVLRGGIETIDRYRPVIFIELLRKWAAKFGYHPNEVIELFKKLGYACFTVKGQSLVGFSSMDQDTVETNFFFLHSVKHAPQIEICSKSDR